jgi:hypothetical protein
MVYEYHLLHHATVVEHIIKSVARDYTMQAAAQSPSEMFGNLLREPRWEQCFWDTVPREVTMVIGAWSTHTTSRETVGAVDLPELQHRIWCKWCECMSIDPGLILSIPGTDDTTSNRLVRLFVEVCKSTILSLLPLESLG